MQQEVQETERQNLCLSGKCGLGMETLLLSLPACLCFSEDRALSKRVIGIVAYSELQAQK